LDLGTNEGGTSLGSSDASGATSGAFAVTTATSSTDVDCSASGGSASGVSDDGPSLSPLLGTWKGYVENYQFPSGSDSVAITFSQQTGGPITATVTYGEGTPTPATDPNADYPPGTTWGPAGGQISTFLLEGFPFTALNVAFDGTRLQLQTSANDAWTSWCALQTPTPDGWPMCYYSCLPRSGGGGNQDAGVTVTDPVTGQMTTVSFCKAWLCDLGPEHPCTCSATKCTADLSQPDTSLDMQLSPSKLDGSIKGLTNLTVSNVHFTLSP
jgi:hypothetical protein